MGDKLTQSVAQAANHLAHADRVACLTGAGISAESGIPTFRGTGGIWEGLAVEQVATPEAFAENPQLVWRFYQARRAALLPVKPNRGHAALVTMANLCPRFTLITQNVDGLHHKAGSTGVLCLHGDIWIDRCDGCGWRTRATGLCDRLGHCSACGQPLRPGVVWFGETLPQGVLERAVEACTTAQVMVVVGTSSVIQPAASLAHWAREAGATIIEVNPERTALSGDAHVVINAPAGEVLPGLVQLWASAPRRRPG